MTRSKDEQILLDMLSAYQDISTKEQYQEAYKVTMKAMLALAARARGGAAKTEAKAEAARANGAKGGRPRKKTDK